MNNSEIIKQITNIYEKPFEIDDGNYKTIKYFGNIKIEEDLYKLKTNPCFTIVGKNLINRYESLFLMLLKNLKFDNVIDINSFINKTQDLLFENRFNVNEIINIIKSLKEENIVLVKRIYGVCLKHNKLIKCGKFILIDKKKIRNYLKKFILNVKNEIIIKSIDGFIEFEKESSQFIYILYFKKTYDVVLARLEFNEKVNLVISALKFILNVQNKQRSYIDSKPFNNYFNHTLALNEKGMSASSFALYSKNICLELDSKIINSKVNGYDIIWKILSEGNPNEFETNIIYAIFWVSKAQDENFDDLTIAEISFAFENLLSTNQRGGITSILSEHYAFINGHSFVERIKLEKEFKDFYDKRSNIIHGRTSSNKSSSISVYFDMVYNTLKNVLKNKKILKCSSKNEVDEYFKSLKYKKR